MKKLLLLLICCSLLAGSLFAQTTVFLNPDKDNSIYQESQTNSNGLGSLYNGVNGAGFAARALLHFDIAGNLPANATISQAILRLDLHKRAPGASTQNFSLHVVTQDWGEGSSSAGTTAGGGGGGAPAVAPDATWTDAMLGSALWTTPGGDFVGTPSATTSVSGVGQYAWFNTNMNVDVQSWYDTPANNFGWILKIDDEVPSLTAAAWGSKDQGVAPVLEVTYSTTLGLEDITADSISFYPNPVKDFLNFRGADNLIIEELSIYNVLGQAVMKLNDLDASRSSVDLTGLNAGIYIVEIQTDKGSTTKRIVIE